MITLSRTEAGYERVAVFSDCQKYRYSLRISWDTDKPMLNFLMLNPSTADHLANDPTVERCEMRAFKLGFGAVVITNIFAFRATDPRDMKAQADPVGVDNDRTIIDVSNCCDRVVCAWGSHGSYLGRATHVRRLLQENGITPFCLGVTKSGQPVHPLYQSYDKQLVPL